jgi:hypothetical protein
MYNQNHNWIIPQDPNTKTRGLILSSLTFAKNTINLTENNIKAVISLYTPGNYNPPYIKFPEELNINHKHIQIEDED